MIYLSAIVLALRPWGLYDLVWPYIAKSPSYMLFTHIFVHPEGHKKAQALPKNSARNSRITGLRMRGEQPILAGFFSRAFCFCSGCVCTLTCGTRCGTGGRASWLREAQQYTELGTLSRLSQLTHTHTLIYTPATDNKKEGRGVEKRQ